MAHLLDALEQGTDIGHFGRLTFVMVASHILDEEEMVSLLSQQPDHNAEDARVLVWQVQAHDCHPPKRERILEWRALQDFPSAPRRMNQVHAMYSRNCSSLKGSTSISVSSMKNRSKLRKTRSEKKGKHVRGVLSGRVI